MRPMSPRRSRRSSTPDVPAARTELPVAELAGVRVPVLALGVQHTLHVRTGLRERNRLDRHLATVTTRVRDPTVNVGLAAVVGGQGEHGLAAVVIEQEAQVVAAVGDVDPASTE